MLPLLSHGHCFFSVVVVINCRIARHPSLPPPKQAGEVTRNPKSHTLMMQERVENILQVKRAFLVTGDSVGWTVRSERDTGFVGDWSWCDAVDAGHLAPPLHHLAYIHLQ